MALQRDYVYLSMHSMVVTLRSATGTPHSKTPHIWFVCYTSTLKRRKNGEGDALGAMCTR